MSSVRKFLTATLFEYETQKVIAISSYKIGLIYRGIQLLIVTYVVGWVMLREKGYQSFDTVVSGVTTKLKAVRMSSVRKFLTATLFEYETQKVIAISSYKIGLIYRGIQLLIVTYVVGWVMLREKGYQSFDTVVSGVTTKLKGLEYTNYTNIPSIGDRIWDVADWAVPPQMNSAFFVTTNVVITKNQSQTTCEEDKDNRWHASCKSDADCQKGHVHMLGWGVKTGRCVLMTHVKNFTVLIKNSVEFPKFGVKRRNILTKMTNRYLKTCNYRPNHPEDRYCPIFKLGDIIKYGQAISEKAAKQIWITGGMVAIDIHWECNFDYDEEHCKPEYKFRNLEDGKVGQGWNFRHAYHYVEDGIHKRTLVKAFGIQFFISVTGRGGKFDILNFTMNLGSGLALLTLATVLCDIIVLNIMRKRKKYRQAKIDKVKRKEIERAKTIRESDRGGRRRGKRNRLGGATESAPGALGSTSFTGHLSTPNSASLAVSGADLSDISACGGGGSSGGNNGIPFADAPTSPT
uniref:ATP receptor n=1 Tax=Macrostomum lignano TaxID=282301 RepID=A0A1I8G2Z9_9PLAT